MRAGRLRHRITFEQKISSRNDDNDLVETWETATVGSQSMVNVPAEVLSGPGKELIAAGALHSEVSARINLHWFAGFTTAWRIRHGAEIYDITMWSTDATGRRELRLACKAGVNNG